MDLTIDQINYYFHYDRENGKLYWKNHWDKAVRTKMLGKEVGAIERKGYRVFLLNYKTYKVHRIIYLIEVGFLPPKNYMIDHINGVKTDNRFINLRVVTNRQNCQNKKRHREGKLVGTSWFKRDNLWLSQIQINGEYKYLGYFNTELEAHQRYMQELKARGLA